MIERKCLKCQTWNGDEKFCKTCGAPLAPEEIIKAEETRKAEEAAREPKDRYDLFMERLKGSRYLAARIAYYCIYSVTALFVAIGSFLAWAVAMSNA
jgi:hypothetical protein